MIHDRHWFVNVTALRDIDPMAKGPVLDRLINSLEPGDQVLLTVDNGMGIVAFSDEPCDCGEE